VLASGVTASPNPATPGNPVNIAYDVRNDGDQPLALTEVYVDGYGPDGYWKAWACGGPNGQPACNALGPRQSARYTSILIGPQVHSSGSWSIGQVIVYYTGGPYRRIGTDVGTFMVNAQSPAATPIPTATRASTATPIPVATANLQGRVANLARVGDCQWDVTLEVTGLRPGSRVIMSDVNYEYYDCRTGTRSVGSWFDHDVGQADSSGRYVGIHRHNDYGTYHWIVRDDSGHRVQFDYTYGRDAGSR
jgi:hypothetical protein